MLLVQMACAGCNVAKPLDNSAMLRGKLYDVCETCSRMSKRRAGRAGRRALPGAGHALALQGDAHGGMPHVEESPPHMLDLPQWPEGRPGSGSLGADGLCAPGRVLSRE